MINPTWQFYWEHDEAIDLGTIFRQALWATPPEWDAKESCFTNVLALYK